MKLIYGKERLGTVPRSVRLDENWAEQISNWYATLLGVEVVWQCVPLSGLRGDLIIVEQSNRLLVNFLLLILRMVGLLRLAFWGHGRNLQTDSHGFSERLKAILITRVDWWFAYTELTASYVQTSGFPRARVTCVNNSIDTARLEKDLLNCSDAEISGIVRELGLERGYVGMYCGGMYVHKQIPFLLEACASIKKIVPQFSMIFVGDGPDDEIVKAAAKKWPWIHYVGPKFEKELAPFFRVCDVLLQPGALGLVVLDSFVVGSPIVSTTEAKHGPEVAYLEDGVNCFLTDGTVSAYVAAVVRYLSDSELKERMAKGLAQAKGAYSIDMMVARFADGVQSALEAQ